MRARGAGAGEERGGDGGGGHDRGRRSDHGARRHQHTGRAPPPPAREGSAPPRPIPRRLTARRAPPRRWTWSSSACSFSGRRATAAPCSLSPPRRHPVRAPAHAPPAARPREGTERAVRDGFFVCGGQIWRAEGLRAFYVSYPTTLAMNIPARPAPAPPRSARRTAPRGAPPPRPRRCSPCTLPLTRLPPPPLPSPERKSGGGGKSGMEGVDVGGGR